MFYVNIFFIYSFLGFLFESFFAFVSNSQFNSGVLYGPWTFIYGIAIFVLMLFNKFLNQYKINKWLKVFIFFIGATILMTLIEFSGGMLIEKILHVVYWNYTNLNDNYGYYIAFKTSIGWGVFATLVNYLLMPFLNRFAKKIPWYVSILFVMFFIIDVIITFFY